MFQCSNFRLHCAVVMFADELMSCASIKEFVGCRCVIAITQHQQISKLRHFTYKDYRRECSQKFLSTSLPQSLLQCQESKLMDPTKNNTFFIFPSVCNYTEGSTKLWHLHIRVGLLRTSWLCNRMHYVYPCQIFSTGNTLEDYNP
jgi:hypothetical protein